MKRFLVGSGLLVLVLMLSPAVVRAASSLSPEEDPAPTARYLASLQNADGGFGGKPGEKSSLGSTSSAARTLKNVGGSIPDVLACLKYLRSCFDRDSGGFAPTPGGTPDVRTTAVALMAVADMKIASDEMTDGALRFFSANARSFEDIRIAVAGLEAVEKTSPDFPRWIAQVEKDRNPDGTWGQGAAKYRDTGGAAVALLRMGAKFDRRDVVVDVLRAGQNPDGAWSKGEAGSDLEATYRIMRAFFMLKELPDLERLRGFLARCRQSDGSYATQPRGEGDLTGTYYATTILRWVRLLGGEPALVETAGFVPLFNGKDLAGWEGDTAIWSARDGALVGTSHGLKHNDFLWTERSYGEFILKLTFRLTDGAGNSGVQFRSDRLPPHEMIGYQADLGQGYWGALYDESRRKRVLVQASDAALKELRKTRWNEYGIRAMGPKIRLTLNGKTSVDYTESDAGIKREGKIAVQVHSGGPTEVAFKDVYIQPLPQPEADGGNSPSESPGFHLRTVKTEAGERKYTVYLPVGYDGKKSFPVALFLHGSGERGSDGVTSAQVGLGAAIFGHPGDYPLIGVFPQAERTWQADSDDARAALASLDDVLKTYQADRDRVILTGLSMGGAGTWSIAAANADRFAAIVPVCGRGQEENARILKPLPAWAFVGDADRAETVLNTRAMVEALRAVGGSARETEYRGVGHNSWDRAYNDPALIAWMLAQSRR
jgi:poly(3-hydroxybutyrate) depolymerase/prenyltransferase beta subunit